MKRDDFKNDGVYSEIFDETPLLVAASDYMMREYNATGNGRWNGPGPGVFFSQFNSPDGREYKVKAFYYAVEGEGAIVGETVQITKDPEQRIEVVEVLERAILNRKRGRL